MANGKIIRKNVDNLSDDELAAIRDAYSKMQQITDNRGYNYWAGLHGIPHFYCWHGPRTQQGGLVDLFLPWHRAYTLYFEQAARDQNAGATLAWWDWTSDVSHASGVPAAFSAEQVNGDPNPLYKGHISAPDADPPLDRDTLRFPGDPGDLPVPDDVNALLSLTHFEDFSSQLQGIHNNIHGWTGGVSPDQTAGGDMGSVPTAAWDPIFWSHHCQIDRIWYMWQLQNGANNIPQNYFQQVLAPFHLVVSDVLDISRLGYEYASSSVTL